MKMVGNGCFSIFLNEFTLGSDNLPGLYKSSQNLTFESVLIYVSAGNNLLLTEELTQRFFSSFFSIISPEKSYFFLTLLTILSGSISPNRQRT